MSEDTYILIIDDEESVLGEFENTFVKEGYEVKEASTWQDAVCQLKELSFNVVIADVNMPDINYKDMIAAIKKENKSIYVITTTGYSDIERAMDSINAGAQDYISKPFDSVDLVSSMRKVVEKQHLQNDNMQLIETIKERQ